MHNIGIWGFKIVVFVYDIVYFSPISYTLSRYRARYCLFRRLADAGPSVNRPETSKDEENPDLQMDADDLRDYEDQFLDDFSPAKGPIAQFLAYLPGSMDAFQDGLLKAMDCLPMPQPGPVPPGVPLVEAIEVRNPM